jgi:hypothetical protein
VLDTHGFLKGRVVVESTTAIEDWLRLIQAEYLEIPGLCLTPLQVQRLWNLDGVTAESLIAALVDARFLRRTDRGAYVLAHRA